MRQHEESPVEAVFNEQSAVAQAKQDTAAFSQLYDYYFPRVYSYVIYRVQSEPAAADITSDVFERAFRQLQRYDPHRAAFSTWLFTIARNAIKNHYRRKRWLPLEAIRERIDSRPEPETVVANKEERDRLLAALAHLDDREREIIALKFGAGQTNRHIAQVMELSESNVAVILYRAVNKLKATLQGGSDE